MSEEFGLLYAVPTFWEGVARVMDMGDTLTEYNFFEDGEVTDDLALRLDWQAVGNDLRAAIAQYREEYPQLKTLK